MKTREQLKKKSNKAGLGMDLWDTVHDVADVCGYKNLSKYANEKKKEKACDYLFALFESLIDAIIK